MLIILLFLLITISLSLLIIKRNREVLYLFFMCLSLTLMVVGTLIYIAKKGGISSELQSFFFINQSIKFKMQYMFIKLSDLGFLIAIGRYLFPMFLLLLALHFVPLIQNKIRIISKAITIAIPVMTILIYYPNIFNYITERNVEVQKFIMNFTLSWIIIYLLISLFLFISIIRSIQVKLFQRNFFLIVTFIFSLTLLYILYFFQDPAQVYQFYNSKTPLTGRIFYLKSVLPVSVYITIIILNILAAIVGFASMVKYTQEISHSFREGEIVRFKKEAVTASASTFVHGMKNQLLINEVIHKKINKIDKNNQDDLYYYIEQLDEQNKNMLQRIDELYKIIRTNHVRLIPNNLETIVNDACLLIEEKIEKDFITFKKDFTNDLYVLADKTYLTEAIFNIIVNAYEAISITEGKGIIHVKTYRTRFYNVIEISDNGIGISKSNLEKIDEAFYSQKNTNNNWGMGLYFTKEIMEEHLGYLRYVSEYGKGSTFYMYLPKYKKRKGI